jgi:hypothetical protein
MRTHVHFDVEGVIHSIVHVTAPEGAGMMLAARPGLSVAETEGLRFKGDASDLAKVRALAKSHKVSLQAARLVPDKKR